MRYFTPELWIGLQDPETGRESSRKWDENAVAYLAQLEGVRARLSDKAYDFFRHPKLHDGEVRSLAVIPTSFKTRTRTTRIELVVDEYDRGVFDLTYGGVRRIEMSRPAGDMFVCGPTDPLGNWGYDELTSADDNYLRHEILCDSGTVILIEFRKFSYRVRNRPGRRSTRRP